MNPHQIVKTMDNMPRILFWTVDEFCLIVVPIFLGLCLASLVVMAMGFVLKPFYKKAKKRFPNGLLKHRLYWILPTIAFKQAGKLKKIPPSHLVDLSL